MTPLRKYRFTYTSQVLPGNKPISATYYSVVSGLEAMRFLGIKKFEIETQEVPE
jgi:hypothetical protein